MEFNRRKVLKSIGTAGVGLPGLSGTASGADSSVLTLRGTIDSPITFQEVKDLQGQFTKEVNSPDVNPASFGLIQDPTYEKKALIGYGIKYDRETKSPTEIIRTVPNPDSIGEFKLSDKAHRIGQNDGQGLGKRGIKKEINKRMTEVETLGLEKAVEQSHREIDDFGKRNTGGI